MQNKYNRLVPFLQDLYREVNNSEKSFYDFFETKAENIQVFKDTDIFKKHLMQYPEQDDIINALFPQMSKDFGDGKAYHYLPDEDGRYTQQQRTIFHKLADFLTETTGANTTPPPAKTTMQNTTKLMKEAGNLEIIEPLKLNRTGNLITGKVRNTNDPSGEALQVFIDPNKPEEIGFKNEKGEMFKVENSAGGLGIFIGASSSDILEFTGQSKKETKVTIEERGSSYLAGGNTSLPTTSTPTQSQEESGDELEDESMPEIGGMSAVPQKGKQKEESKDSDIPQESYEQEITKREIAPKRIVGANQPAPRPVYKQATEEGTSLRLPTYASKMNLGRTTEEKLKKNPKGAPQEQTEAPATQPRTRKDTTTNASSQAQSSQKKGGYGKKALVAAAGFAGISIPGILVITDIV